MVGYETAATSRHLTRLADCGRSASLNSVNLSKPISNMATDNVHPPLVRRW